MSENSIDSEERVLLFHNVPSPYRLPVFEGLAKECDLKVVFLRGNEDYREWDADLNKFNFRYKFLPNINIGPFAINYTLLFELLHGEYDTYVIGDTKHGLLTTSIAVLFGKLTGVNILLWSGWLSTDFSTGVESKGLIRGSATKMYRQVRNSLQRFLYPLADGFLSYSSLTTQYLVDRGADPDSIVEGGQVMPVENLPSPSDEVEEENIVLFLSYLQKRKGIDILLDAWERVDTGDWKLVIAGSGPYEDQIQSHAEENDTVKFEGYTQGKDKANLYCSARIFVLPTLHDPWGLVINEAVYYDTPVITTQAAGASDFVEDSECGVVIRENDQEVLADALERMVNDEEHRAEYRQRASSSSGLTEISEAVDTILTAVEHAK
jgi:glycosyltransferase involved in cell wall biosynthesis